MSSKISTFQPWLRPWLLEPKTNQMEIMKHVNCMQHVILVHINRDCKLQWIAVLVFLRSLVEYRLKCLQCGMTESHSEVTIGLLAVKFLAFWKLRTKSLGTTHCWSPNLKVGEPISPGPQSPRLLRLWTDERTDGHRATTKTALTHSVARWKKNGIQDAWIIAGSATGKRDAWNRWLLSNLHFYTIKYQSLQIID